MHAHTHMDTHASLTLARLLPCTQSVDAMVSKLFACTYSATHLNVFNANPGDHLVHKMTHRVVQLRDQALPNIHPATPPHLQIEALTVQLYAQIETFHPNLENLYFARRGVYIYKILTQNLRTTPRYAGPFSRVAGPMGV